MTGIVVYCLAVSLFYCLAINFGIFLGDKDIDFSNNLRENFVVAIVCSVLFVVMFSPTVGIMTMIAIISKLHGIYIVAWIGMISLGIIFAYIKCPQYAKIVGGDFFTNKQDKHEFIGLMYYLFLLLNTIFFPFIVPINYILVGIWKVILMITVKNKFYTAYVNATKGK